MKKGNVKKKSRESIPREGERRKEKEKEKRDRRGKKKGRHIENKLKTVKCLLFYPVEELGSTEGKETQEDNSSG